MNIHQRLLDLQKRGLFLPRPSSLISVRELYDAGEFETDEQAQGAFKLAWSQACDGMGTTPQEWMGLTDAEYERWCNDGTLPPKTDDAAAE